MEQRPLRLGDIVDDYCPRERRLTNHVIVALVDDAIRQTRCTTCDAEHVYKEARVPRRRKKDETAALYDQVLADVSGAQLVQPRASEPAEAPPSPAVAASPEPPPAGADAEPADDRQESQEPATSDDTDTAVESDNGHNDLWPAHRRLIRASLPRTDNDPPAPRPIPEFTMHQRPQHRGGFRHGHGHGFGWHGNGNGQPRHHAGGQRPPRPNGEPNGNVKPSQGRRRSRHRGKHRRPR